MMDTIRQAGISLKTYALGTHRTTCPSCSPTRRKKNDPCLSVTITGDGAVWRCHHCGHSGGTKTAQTEKKPFKKSEYQKTKSWKQQFR